MTPQRVNVSAGPLSAELTVPGSKSLTNRALLVAGLARGTSRIESRLVADDTNDMLGLIAMLGAEVTEHDDGAVSIIGCGGKIASGPLSLNTGLGGTTTRFVTAACALGQGEYSIDAAAPMRARPMAELLEAITQLGAGVGHHGEPGMLPVTLSADGLAGGSLSMEGTTSSQFITAMLLVAPWAKRTVDLQIEGGLVSAPYLDLTRSVMNAFGATVSDDGNGRFTVEPTGYDAITYVVEGDASSASYPAAAAAIVGGTVRIDGLGRDSAQGDLEFVRLLGRMGADVTIAEDHIVVTGTGALRGVDVDMRDFSDTAPTMAVVAACAQGRTEVTGIGFIRRKESDRIGAVVDELRRFGVDARGVEDGMIIEGTGGEGLQPVTVDPHGDHRLAMAFSLLGLVTDGVAIADPGCVAKSWPGWWTTLEQLR